VVQHLSSKPQTLNLNSSTAKKKKKKKKKKKEVQKEGGVELGTEPGPESEKKVVQLVCRWQGGKLCNKADGVSRHHMTHPCGLCREFETDRKLTF
jgi:hypothetical protein